ncbi:trypsin-like serine peptidase [Teichococcus rhizosphaerae]|nr:trypsin-like serine protease [Pseudoroseomonas rhizosphaerae]
MPRPRPESAPAPAFPPARTVVLLAASLLALPPGLAAADPSLLPGVGAGDPRRRADVSAPPWTALGRVQTELGGRCTGVLIGPRHVLTAAHCLVAPRARALVRPGSIHFLRGYRMGEWSGQARVLAYRTGAGFDAARSGPAGADWAVLTLDRPLGRPEEALPLLPTPPAPGAALLLGGYQQDRPEVLMADSGCRVLAAAPLLLHDCAGTRGSSGAPLLVADGAGWAVAGVAVGVARDRRFGIAVPAAALPGALMADTPAREAAGPQAPGPQAPGPQAPGPEAAGAGGSDAGAPARQPAISAPRFRSAPP